MKTSKRTKAVMVGHAVCIEQPRPEWEAVKWKFATVLQGWEDGSALVEFDRAYFGGSPKRERAVFSASEIKHVVMNDYLRHNACERLLLIARCSELRALASLCTNGYLKQGEHSDRLRAALERRVQRLIGEVGALDRADRSRTARIAFAARYGLHNSCTALVPVDGRAS